MVCTSGDNTISGVRELISAIDWDADVPALPPDLMPGIWHSCISAVKLINCKQRRHNGNLTMAMLTVRNLPDEVHRALRVRAALRGRSTEAEVRVILAETVLPEGRATLGTLLTAIGRRAGLTDEEFAGFAQRDSAPARPIGLE